MSQVVPPHSQQLRKQPATVLRQTGPETAVRGWQTVHTYAQWTWRSTGRGRAYEESTGATPFDRLETHFVTSQKPKRPTHRRGEDDFTSTSMVHLADRSASYTRHWWQKATKGFLKLKRQRKGSVPCENTHFLSTLFTSYHVYQL